MKTGAGLLALFVFAGPAIAYFKYQRPVQVPGTGQQYFAVQQDVWRNARPDLGDLRLYNGQTERPYALLVQRGSLEHDRKAARLLQQSRIAGKTQFIIDMSDVVEYDHIDLDLATKNFVAHARVEGQDDLHGRDWAMLAETILYDLSREHLGGNAMLRLPVSAYKYLRVTIDGPVTPEDVLGASSEFRQEQKAVWRDIGGPPANGRRPEKTTRSDDGNLNRQSAKATLLTFSVPENAPVERVVLEVDPEQPNFRREVEIQDEEGGVIGSGEINRIHMVRSGRKIDSEKQELDFSAQGHKAIQVIIYNGDDPPLKLKTARLQQYERRIYFDGQSSDRLALYYGDNKLEPPVYDYAKLFQQEKDAKEAQLGREEANAAYSGRPDERPWTERHPIILWIAIIAAVLVLGAIAVRSMKTAAAPWLQR
ncbi:MAG TPA: DUF3999 family protein [Candidatus Angelobacter sp.]|nr:DUF3999 family protein [Candidatus Angelobacter sp.]